MMLFLVGGGSGAPAQAQVTGDKVTHIVPDPDHRGSGYLNPPTVAGASYRWLTKDRRPY
jgi:hypothetical protein